MGQPEREDGEWWQSAAIIAAAAGFATITGANHTSDYEGTSLL